MESCYGSTAAGEVRRWFRGEEGVFFFPCASPFGLALRGTTVSEPGENRDPGLIAYAFPLKDGTIATLYLPRKGLTLSEAGRLKNYIDSITFIQPSEGVRGATTS